MPVRLTVARVPLAAPTVGREDAALWLAPTADAAADVRLAVGRSRGVALGPVALTLQEFADAIVRAADPLARPLLPHMRRLLLDALADHGGRFAASRGFADATDRAVREWQRTGVAPPAATRLNDKFAAACRTLGRLTPEDRLARAADLWAAGRRGPFATVTSVAVVGFDSFAAIEQKLLDAVFAACERAWVTLPAGGHDETFAGPRRTAGQFDQPAGDLFAAIDAPREVVHDDWPDADPRPAGLTHLAANLFADAPPSADAAGLHRIEAPGAVGEARLVARHIRTLLAGGANPHAIVVTARPLDRLLPLLAEVFDEYAIPYQRPAAEPLAACPAVAFLLRAWRLADDDFPFPATAAVLRNTHFRPPWPDVAADPELPARAEALLRMLGEPRGKDAYLHAVRTWSENPPLPLEDEQAEEPRRRRLARLAARCRGFVGRFFRLWERIPEAARPAAFATRLRRFAADIGVSSDAVGVFFAELDRWATTDLPAVASRKTITRAAFARLCDTLATHALQVASPGIGVRLRAPEDAQHAACDHLIVLNLGEGTFPQATDDESGLPAEMLLFARLVSRPRLTLTLSHPAVDDQGQPLLPSSFLTAAVACFEKDAIPPTRQKMAIEGYTTRVPLSAAEHRVQVAAAMAAGADAAHLPPDLAANLTAARAASVARHASDRFGPFDGLLRHPAIVRELGERFGPAKVFSPTALETYAACPFRFWLEHVLRLEPLDDPGEEIEHTRRGAAVHRALARFHKRIRDDAPHLLDGELPEALTAELEEDVLAAVGEYADRAPEGPSRVLWRLEGRRLLRSLRRYRGHWERFRGPWRKEGADPRPFALEADFGTVPEPGQTVPAPLVLTVGGVEIRLGGRIDRVDVADLGDGSFGFWVIDYKTGRGSGYPATAIAAFERLQLPLYAIAVERVLFAGKTARPLGLAYWLVTDGGPKPVLPDRRKELAWRADGAGWAEFRGKLEGRVAALAGHVRAGDFPLAPRSETCTDTCPFGPTCRIAVSRAGGKRFAVGLPVIDEPRKAVAAAARSPQTRVDAA